MSTIKKVADHAGVSVATVSRVINKTGYVSLDLQERVTEAMQLLNYQPSALARSLRRQETQTIGVLVPQLDHPFFSRLAFAIEKTLFGNQYRAFMCSSEEDQEKEDAYIDMLLRQRVDGVILVPTGQSVIHVRRLQERQVPVVLVDRDLPSLEFSRVLTDNSGGGVLGIEHLVGLGHTHIGIVGGPHYSEAMVQRLRGVYETLEKLGIHHHLEEILDDHRPHFEQGYQGANALLAQVPRPTAIFALTDMMAIGVLHAASEAGLSIPRDLSVMGFDNVPMSAYTQPALTTIEQPIYTMGETAAELLLDQINTQSLVPERVLLETRLVVRNSTGAPPQG